MSLTLSPDTSGRIMGLITYFTKLSMDFKESLWISMKYINCQSVHSLLEKNPKLFYVIVMTLDLKPISDLIFDRNHVPALAGYLAAVKLCSCTVVTSQS